MSRAAPADDEFVSGIVPSQTVLWSGAEPPPGVLRDLLAECGYALHGRDLDEWPARRVAWLWPAPLSARDKYDLTQRRLAVVHPDPGAADALAEALRARGAQVIVLSLGETGLDRAEALDPDAVIMQPERFWPAGRSVVNALWQHPWLRWTPVLFVPAERLGSASASAPDVRELAQGLRTLSAAYDQCSRRARGQDPFELRLCQLGPVRTLRALLESGSALRLRLEAPQRVYELDLGEGLVIGARVAIQRGPRWEELLGVHAVKSLLARMDGHVQVTRVAHPALANIMAPLEALLLSGPQAQPAAAAGKSPAALAGPRAQATLVGMPAPMLQLPAPQAAAAAEAPAIERGDLERADAMESDGEDDDASPTRTFQHSLRPLPAAVAEATLRVAPAPSARRRWRALASAHAGKLLLAVALFSGGAVWAAARATLPVAVRIPPSAAPTAPPVGAVPPPLAPTPAIPAAEAAPAAPQPVVTRAPAEARARALRAKRRRAARRRAAARAEAAARAQIEPLAK
jgi:CheY-like chemotaxis protein